jgi:dihydroorotate dehydrogenase electron transfer subunit
VRQLILRVFEISTASGGQIRVRCDGEAAPRSTPGQVWLARAESPTQPFLRLPLFPDSTPGGGFEFLVDRAHPYAALAPGLGLDLVGPVGRGFSLPPRAAHVLLVAASLERLSPLLYHALERQFAVAVLIPESARLPALPPAVEVQRGPLTHDLAGWADVVALDVPDPEARAREVRALVPTRPAGFVQALITPPMPCGVGACQACGVEIGRGRRLACVDGPVFPLSL